MFRDAFTVETTLEIALKWERCLLGRSEEGLRWDQNDDDG